MSLLRLRSEIVPAIRTNDPLGMNDAATAPARRDQGFLAVRTVLEVQTHPFAAVGTDRCEFLFLLSDFLPLSFYRRPNRRHGSQHGALKAVILSRPRLLSAIRTEGDSTAGTEVLRLAIWMMLTLHELASYARTP